MSRWVATPEVQRRVGCSYQAVKAAYKKQLIRAEIGNSGRVSKVWEADLDFISAALAPGKTVAPTAPARKEADARLDMLLRMSRIVEPAVSGVYFLFDAGELVYVGQSINVFARVASHTKAQRFDRYAFLPCPPGKLLEEEARMIRIFQPRNNRAAPAVRYRDIDIEMKASSLFRMVDDLAALPWPQNQTPGILSYL